MPRPCSGLLWSWFLLFTLATFVGHAAPAPQQLIGNRPYELDWAGRTQDDHPPLVDFEDTKGWRVETKNAVAEFTKTREQQIWGDYVGKLTYRATNSNPELRIHPPQAVRLSRNFDTVSIWVYGNNWGYAPDPKTPPVQITALLTDSEGKAFNLPLHQVNWTEWFYIQRRLSPELIQRCRGGGTFEGLLVTGGRNQENRTIYLDNLAVFVEAFPPLTFEARARRGIDLFPGQSPGNNTGPGRLPFPTRPETILPDNLVKDFRTTVRQDKNSFVLQYKGGDDTLVWRLQPRTGTWSDLTVDWSSSQEPGSGTAAKPCVDGGIYLQTPAGPRLPEQAEHLGTALKNDVVESRWRLSTGKLSAEVEFHYRLWNKSLVIDVIAPGGQVGEVRYGKATGLQNPRLVTNPFYPAEGGRPAVAVFGPVDKPLFLTGNTDWYLSNASIMWARNAVEAGGVVYQGGTRYLARTDGRRNDCFERFFLTLSPRYEEMLPTIANPPSPWKQVSGTRLWRAHGASNRERDAAFWTDCRRWGMTQVVVTDHETGWRDGGESFTFRTRPAPGKGGDQGQYDYARLMQDKLGFVYGPYNNFTDFAPVNEFWSADMISRSPDNQLQGAWMRCYAPKPARAVEYCARLAPEIQRKFRFSTAYCDVHTAVAPWHRVDYDARVPGAGTFGAVFYSFGEIMLLQKHAWQGPVYSEGNYHCFYTGLTDGNYGQDQSYRPAINPWLVDFDLRKMHDLGCNFGMGNPDMFYASAHPPQNTPAQRDEWLDRFLAATVAFGHPGFLTYEGGVQNALRSYYMLQQLHSRYCLASAQSIAYADENGRLLNTSAAVATGAYKRSQVVTRYSDGTVTAANGSPEYRMKVQAFGAELDLPPNGYCGWTDDGAIRVQSGDRLGHRCDYAISPDYLYVDGRGQFVRFTNAAGNGIGICRILGPGHHEILLHGGAECGFRVHANRAVALDKAGKSIGPATLRRARGLTYVLPVEGAFSYELTAAETGTNAAPEAQNLTCERDEVIAGERVVVHGKAGHEIRIPLESKPGERIWIQREDRWIDFTVVPLARVDLRIKGNNLQAQLTPCRLTPESLTVSLQGTTRKLRLEAGKSGTVAFDLGPPADEWAEVVQLEIRNGETVQMLEQGLRTADQRVEVCDLPSNPTRGMRLRGGTEQGDFGQTATIVEPRRVSVGEVSKAGMFMHPPWQGGVGYAFAQYNGIRLPANPAAAFCAVVGKADGSDAGDGILFKVAVIEPPERSTLAAERIVTTHQWFPIEADLSPWAGQSISLQLIADVGPKDNSAGDWAAWADMRIETLRPVLTRSLEPNIELCRHQSGPWPLQGISIDQLRNARSGRLHYDGKGLSGTGPEYGSFAVLNSIQLGNMAPAGGNEPDGVFQTNVSIPLTREAIGSLGRRNRLTVQNPRGDSFSVRRFWLELQLADGRRCSSEISTATFTQPPEWKYAEGIGIPFGQDIAVEIWFQR